MDERRIGLALALKELGSSCDVSDFDSRLILQKTVYLIEEAGIKLGYTFSWYLRGPYSPSLTRDLFDLASNEEDDATGWVLDEQSRKIAKRVGQLFADKSEEDLTSKARRLELLASLHYLTRRGKVNTTDSQALTDRLAENGKTFSTKEVAVAVQELAQVNLL